MCTKNKQKTKTKQKKQQTNKNKKETIQTVTIKTNKQKNPPQLSITRKNEFLKKKKIVSRCLLYPNRYISSHSTQREFMVSSDGSKNLKIVSFSLVQYGVFCLHDVCFWYHHLLFHLHPIVLVVKVYCGLPINKHICLLHVVYLIIKFSNCIFCR